MRKYFQLFLASTLTLSSFRSPANARPLLVNGLVEVTVGGEGEAGGYTDHNGKFRCQWGCGKHTSKDGEGWGNGEASGKGRPPNRDGNSGTGSGSSSRVGGSGKGRSSSSRSGHSREDGYFGRFDKYTEGQKESKAWEEYNDMVAKLNDQWSGHLTQRHQAEKYDLSQSEKGIDQIGNHLSNEIEINTSTSKDFETLLSQNIPVQMDGYRYLVNDRSELKPLLEYEYQSAQKDELEKIREPLANFKPNSPQSYYAYKAGLQTLKRADQSYLQNEIEVGNFLKESSKILFDVATDLIPITSIPKDLYRTFVGKDPLTGRELVPVERALAGGFVILASVSLGATNLLKGMKEIEVIAVGSAKETAAAKRVIDSATKFGLESVGEIKKFATNFGSPKRTGHILYGDATGGGHMFPGKPGKTVFPESWNGEKIMHNVSDIATDPAISWKQLSGVPGKSYTLAGKPARFEAIGTRESIEIKVIIEPAGEGIISAYPLSGPGVIKNP